MKGLKKKKIVIITAIILLFTAMILIFTKIESSLKASKINDFEHQRSTEYSIVTEDDIKIDNCENVTFSAFFTRDLDGDGYAERLDGTCKEMKNTDKLYMDINVFSEGRLENAKVTLNAKNFVWTTSLVADNIIQRDYLGVTNTVSFKTIQSGTQKLFWGTVSPSLSSNINSYSRVNSVTLTGDYYDNDNNKTTISKTVDFTIDWYGTTSTNLNYYYNTYYGSQVKNLGSLLNDDKTVVNFSVAVSESRENLLLQKQIAEVTLPIFNGYAPNTVKVADNNISYEYDEENRILTITREAIVSDNGNIVSSVSRSNLYNVEVTYPVEAFELIDANTVSLQIPIKGYNYGFNNPNVNISNPHISSSQNYIELKYKRTESKVWDIDSYIGKYSYNSLTRVGKYLVSKEMPDNIYEGNADQNEGKDTYQAYWRLDVGDYKSVDGFILEEGNDLYNADYDRFSTSSTNYISTKDYVRIVEISFKGADEILGPSGYIDLYDLETDEFITRFTKSDWSKPYSANLDRIKIVTSTPIGSGSLYVYQTKEINDYVLTNSIDRTQFNSLSYIYTYLKGTAIPKEGITMPNNTINDYAMAYYENKISIQKLGISSKEITNQKSSDITLLVSVNADGYLQSIWKNGAFLIRLPEEIINAKINYIDATSKGVDINNYNIYQINGVYYIRVDAENKNDIQAYTIRINLTITPNPTLPSTSNRIFRLYAYNDVCNRYNSTASDSYDVNNNGIVTETVGYSSASLDIIAPTGLITSEYISNYNGNGDVAIAPNVAYIDKKDITSDGNATVNITLSNNYQGNISEVEVLGSIPFEGNKKILTEVDMGSQFDTELTGPISVPSELESYVTVYYSTNEKPSKDIEDDSNDWVVAPIVDDWSEIKCYLIKLNDYKLRKNEKRVFSYVIKTPDDVANNLVSFSNHAVYYCLETENGKLDTTTEPNKVGISSVETFNLELSKTKYKYLDILLPGATYSVSTSDYEGNIISELATTDENGILKFEKLYMDREYTLKEITAPSGYALNEEIIKFIATKDENDNFKFNVLEGTIQNQVNPTDDTDGRKLVNLVVSDEALYSLNINKKSTLGENIENVRFLISGKNVNRIVKTDSEGNGTITGLSPNHQYIVKELEAEGYYVDSNSIKFKVVRNESDELIIQNENGITDNLSIVDGGRDDTTSVNLNLTNKPIEKYNLKIVKVEECALEDDLANMKKLKDAKYAIESIDLKEINSYTTDENGEINVNDLYVYVPDKTITGWYTIKETEAPDGYCACNEEISFRVSKDEEENLIVSILNQGELESVKDVIADKETNTVTIVLEDKPLFKLTKIDAETGEPLANTDFMIFEVDNQGNLIDHAKDVNGEYVGVLNEDGDYIVTTDENGIIILPLRNGLYEIIEVGYPEGYMERSNSEIFKIDDKKHSEDEEDEFTAYDYSKVTEINNIEDLVNLSLYINNGYTINEKYITENIKLMRTLDFKEDDSYEDPTRTDYGDLNEDGVVESIKEELSKGIGFTPIGTNERSVFSGSFDGQNNEIRNIYINSDEYYVGLFGNTNDAIISNLGVTGDIKVDKNNGVYVGGIVANGASVTNSYSKINIDVQVRKDNNPSYVGGIIGCLNYNNYVTNCYNEGSVSSTSEGERSRLYVGGIAGYCCNYYSSGISEYGSDGYIYNCYNTGNVNGNSISCSSYTGGIVGYSGDVYNCHNTGTVSGETVFVEVSAGGIAGCAKTIYNCYNTGKVKGYVNKDNLQPDSKVGSYRYESSNPEDPNSYGGHLIIGGIAGIANIETCYNTGNIDVNACPELTIDDNIFCVSTETVGGIVGRGNVNNAYNTGNINIDSKNKCEEIYIVTSSAGGISTKSDNYIRNSYNTGNITVNNINYIGDTDENIEIAPITVSDTECENCYYLDSIEFIGAEPILTGEEKTQEEMKNESFVEILGNENWNINPEENDGYPVLKEIDNPESTTNIIEVSKIEDLLDISIDVNTNGNTYTKKTVVLKNDLDFSDANSYKDSQTIEYGDINENGDIEPLITELTTGKGFLPIGKFYSNYFAGIFDGQNYQIKNIYISDRTSNSISSLVGLFGYTDNAIIKNLGVTGIIKEGQYIGSIVGRASNTEIIECYSNVEIVVNGSNYYTGGIVGYGNDCSIINCYNEGNIKSTANRAYIGGIIGEDYNSIVIEKCYNTGNLDISNAGYVGGIIGYFYGYDSNNISLCYNIGELKTDNVNYVGGIVAYIYGYTELSCCYNAGEFVNESNNNLYEGYISGTNINNIYNTYYLDSLNLSSENINDQGISKSDEEMKSENFIKVLGASNWNLDSDNSNKGYPVLLKESESSEIQNELVTEIYTIEDLLNFKISVETKADYANTEVVLMNDLDFNDNNSYENPDRTDYGDINENGIVESLKTELTTECGFSPIKSGFNGIFNGNNNKINNLYINRNNKYIGLFEKTQNAKIKNLGVTGQIFGDKDNSEYVSAIVAYSENTVIDNCYNECSIEGYKYVGGIVAYGKEYTNIYNSYNIGNITSISDESEYNESYIGGICGLCYGIADNCYNDGIITVDRYSNYTTVGGIIGCGYTASNCYNTGELTVNNLVDEDGYYSDSYVGGILGYRSYEFYGEYGTIINNCYNTGNISGKNDVYAGGILGYLYYNYYQYDSVSNKCEINNCYNTGTIDVGKDAGGIVGNGYYDIEMVMTECYNTGNISSKNYAGGIAGEISGNIYKCYNTGTISGTNYAGGIVGDGYNVLINNAYNIGIVNSSNCAGGIAGTAYVRKNFSTIKNSYNTGLVNSNDYAGNIIGSTSSDESIEDSSTLYYLRENIVGSQINTVGTEVTAEELKSEEIYNNLNGDGVWIYKRVDYPKFTGFVDTNIDDILELTIENTIKKYNVKARVEGNVGGTISGQYEDVYEVITYNQSNQKPIEIVPDDGYTITKITLNGSNMNYEANADGSYIIPAEYFTNVQENKTIIVSFASKERILTINKVDQDDNSINLEGAKFNVSQDIINKITTNANKYNTKKYNDTLGPMTKLSSYYEFSQNDRRYVSSNTTSGSTAYGYMKIDLTNKSGNYKVVVNASKGSYGYAAMRVVTSTSYYSYSNSTGRFMYVANNTSEIAKDYTSTNLTGGRVYYLHFTYYKNNGNSSSLTINSVNVYGTDYYSFEEDNGKYISNNYSNNDTIAYSYLPIDLTNAVGKVKLKINAEVYGADTDYGDIIINQSSSVPNYNYQPVKDLYLTGEVEAKDYEYTLEGGNLYYVHFGYHKGDSEYEGTERFIINSIELDYGNLITIDNGKAQIGLPVGTYKIIEVEAPKDYTLNSTPQTIDISYTSTNELTFTNKKQTVLNVHHYLKNSNGEYTQLKVAEDEVYKGDIGSEYTTSPRIDLEGLELEKDESDNYKLPENAVSTYGEDEINVNYYYEPAKVKLKIHHYLLGTENKLKEDDEIEVNGNVIFNDDGSYRVYVEAEYDLDTNEKYTELVNDYMLMNVISLDQGILNIEDQYSYNSNSEIIYYYDVDSIGVTEQKVWKNLEKENAKKYRSTFRAYENIETADSPNELIEVNGKQYVLLENVAEQVVVGNGSVNLNLPKYAGQNEREYILVETKAEKYDSSNDLWVELTENEQYRKSENGLVTTNELLAKVTKEVVWKDTSDEIASNYRATLKLYREAEDGEESVEINGKQYVELDSKLVTGNGQVEYEGLPVYENDKEIEYYVFESKVEQNDGENWITLIEGTGYEVEDSLPKVENTLIRDYKIKKQWNLTDYANYRATFNLNKTVGENKQLVESKVIRGNGTATFEHLNVYENGAKIEYSVDEVKIEKTENDGETWINVDLSGFKKSHNQVDGFDDLIINAVAGEFGLTINKTEDKSGNPLSGAKFIVSIKDNDENELVDQSKEYITGADGSLVNAIAELAITGAGKIYTVTIIEDGNVDGYKALAGPIEFTVNTRINTQDGTIELFPEVKDVENTKGVRITEDTITVNIENELDTGYKVNYYYDEILEETEEFDAEYGDIINTYIDKPKDGMVLDKVTTSDNNSNIGELPLTIGENKDNNIINVYYKSVFKVEAEITEHTETNKDGISQTVRGGTIYQHENTLYETEDVISGEDCNKDIIIVPDEGYEITKVTITDGTEVWDLSIDAFVRDDGTIVLSKENGFFENVTSNKKVDVEFRKKSKVTVKYLEKGTEEELATEDIINGYDTKAFSTQRSVVTGYRAAEVEVSENETSSETYDDMTKYDENADNVMAAYDIVVIYWYEPIPKGTIIVRHIEIDEEDIRNGLTLNSGREIVINESTIIKAFGLDDENISGESTKEQYEDYVGTEINTERKEFVDNQTGRSYKSVNGPVSNDSNIIIVGKDDNQYNATISENDLNQDGEIDVIEIRYYYERDYVITTAVRTHDENGTEVKGGTISGDGEASYEIVNRKGSNNKIIEVNPDENYHIKSLVINDQEINYENMKDENGNVKFDLNYFNNMIENKNVIVEYEKNLTKVTIKYIDVDTGKEITIQTTKKFEIGQNYEVQAKDIDGYTLVESRKPSNAEGITGLDDIEVIYYYIKNENKENENTEPELEPTEPETPSNENTEPEVKPTEPEIVENGGGSIEDTENKEAKVEIIYTEKENDESIVLLQNASKKLKTNNVKTNDNVIVYLIVFITSNLVMLGLIMKKTKK